jgi:quercetin dioxygenase-like cupin family protein
MTASPQPYMLRRDEGQPVWFLGTLMLLKATGQQNEGQFSLIEQVLPPGFSPPLHVHHAEDEAFYILEGTFRFACGDTQWDVSTGDFVFLPKEIPHSFLVTSKGPARLLQLTAPAGLEHFHVEAGDPADALTLPPPAPPDIERVLQAAGKYQFEIVGPPMGQS